MAFHSLTHLRCKATRWLLSQRFDKRYALANFVCPSTDAIVAAARQPSPPIPLPKVSHIFYHQASVEIGYAENSFKTVMWNVPEEDEVILYDKGGTLTPDFFHALERQHWRSWAVHREVQPDMAAYTYGMNHSLPMGQAPILVVWRSDYLYPKGLYERYMEHIPNHDIVLPYEVIIGSAHVRNDFIRANWSRIANYDFDFWRANADSFYSIYESQDPVHFAVRKDVWLKLGGLNHKLWGYGWQFGEFAARLRGRLPKSRIKYFDFNPPVHQNHASSLMVRSEGYDARKAEEDRIGRERFAEFLGGPDAFECYNYRWNQKLPPLSKEERT